MTQSYKMGGPTTYTPQDQQFTGMVVNRPLKRVKRVVADYYSFHTFGCKGCPGDRPLDGPFRSNIRSFLLAYAEGPLPVVISSAPFVERWRVRLRLENEDGVSITLNIIAEHVKHSKFVYCDHCRIVAGWNEHPVCKRRYHFIIRADNSTSAGKCPERCPSCGAFVSSLASSRCKACGFDVNEDNSVDDGTDFVLEDATHLLHGVIHANGFGHLIRINGREGGSQFVTGCDIMHLWDRICTMLRVRKISVMDVSKKYGLDYRLLHAVEKGHPWYGEWGYEFGPGSFALTHDSYQTSVDILSNFPLTLALSEVAKHDRHLNQVGSFYCSLSKRPILTIRGLVSFIMGLLHKLHGQAMTGKHSGDMFSVDKDSRNTEPAEFNGAAREEMEAVTSAMLKILQVADRSKWITWRDLRAATCKGRDPKVLDFALRQLDGKFAGKQTVQCRCISAMRTLEYRLRDAADMDLETCNLGTADSKLPMQEHVLEDLKYIYHTLLHPFSATAYRLYGLRKQLADASRKLLDCKQFIKDYEANDPIVTVASPTIKVFCVVEILNEPTPCERPPSELLVLPQGATVADLKLGAARAFRDVYIFFKKFRVENIPALSGIKDSTRLLPLLGTESFVVVQGQYCGDLSAFRTERGTQAWTVDCPCGTRDDDGERMIACDNCEVWQHTRCVGIADTEDEPLQFVCKKCSHKSSEIGLDSDHSMLGSSSVSSI